MILFIDTSNSELTTLKLFGTASNLISETTWQSRYNQSEELVQEIDQFLEKNKLSAKDLTSIRVHPGPGSFTGVRIGVTTANFLALGLNIPVEGQANGNSTDSNKQATDNFDEPVIPIYDRPPHITQPKK
ncbi:MAG: tRNA (adenosine(37)-N6)-threonylcarbamoyltransferase complex dimerization subunit type 1 TsaB [Patescibacteria group bacterium]|jgi:tRNA threonylcarbamoyladenosine biosynthesis protein TsaB